MKLILVTGCILALTCSLSAQNFWQEINNGLTVHDVRGIAVGDSGYLFAATESGVFRSYDHGDTWAHLPNSGSITVQSIAYFDNALYAGTEHGMYLSIDHGVHWAAVNTGFPDTLVLSIAVNASGHVFAGTDLGGLFRSTNYGSSWTKLTNGLASDDIATLAINSQGFIYAGSDGNGMFRSTDDGDSWRALNYGMTAPLVRAIGINANDSVFVGENTDGMFRLLNADTTWVPIDSGLAFTFMASIGVQNNGTIYAGTSGGGVYRSTNNGNSWAAVNSGLTDLIIDAIAFDSDGYIYAGSPIGGAYRSTQPITDIRNEAEIPQGFVLNQNYPNPFNPSTSLEFRVATFGFVTLKIYDLLGREISTLVSEELQPGSYKKSWDAGSVASGVYYCRLQTGNETQMRKLLLSR